MNKNWRAPLGLGARVLQQFEIRAGVFDPQAPLADQKVIECADHRDFVVDRIVRGVMRRSMCWPLDSRLRVAL